MKKLEHMNNDPNEELQIEELDELLDITNFPGGDVEKSVEQHLSKWVGDRVEEQGNGEIHVQLAYSRYLNDFVEQIPGGQRPYELQEFYDKLCPNLKKSVKFGNRVLVKGFSLR